VGLHNLPPGKFDVEVVRDLAGKIGIPPTLRSSGKWAAIAGGVVGGLGAIPVLKEEEGQSTLSTRLKGT